MAAEVVTLDSRIRKQASDALSSRIRQAAASIRSEISTVHSNTETGLFDSEGKPVAAYKALEILVSYVVDRKKDEEQDDAVKAFIRKVDGLQEQIEELQSTVGQ